MNCLKTLVKRRNITSPKLKVDILKVLHLATANRSVIPTVLSCLVARYIYFPRNIAIPP